METLKAAFPSIASDHRVLSAFARLSAASKQVCFDSSSGADLSITMDPRLLDVAKLTDVCHANFFVLFLVRVPKTSFHLAL
jgi:hypothetical protein